MKYHAGDTGTAHLSAIAASGVVLGSLALAGLQFVIAKRGMQVTDKTDGLQAIGTAARYVAVDITVTLASVLIGARALGIKHWLVVGSAVALGDLVLLALLWRFLNGENQRSWAGALVFTGALVAPALIASVAATRGSTPAR